MSFKMALSRVKASTRASKWVQNDPQAQKQLQILKAQVMSFSKIYIMLIYEKVDFLSFPVFCSSLLLTAPQFFFKSVIIYFESIFTSDELQ